jgi:hypothetical protein
MTLQSPNLFDLPGTVSGFLPVGRVAATTGARGYFQRCRSLLEFSGRCLLGDFPESVVCIHRELRGIYGALLLPEAMDLFPSNSERCRQREEGLTGLRQWSSVAFLAWW